MHSIEPDDAKITWRKSLYSAGNGACVEVGIGKGDNRIKVRDTKDNGSGPALELSPRSWQSFLKNMKDSSRSY